MDSPGQNTGVDCHVLLQGTHSLPHPSLSPLTFWLSAFSGIPLEKKNQHLGCVFKVMSSGLPHEYLRMVEAHAAPWENQLPLFICESPGTPVGLMYWLRPPSHSSLLMRDRLSSSVAVRGSVIYWAKKRANIKSFLSFFTEMVNGNNRTSAIYVSKAGEQR